MFPLGLGVLFLGFWLAESGIKGRAPLKTLTGILTNPKDARKTLAASGTALAVAQELPVTPGSGTGAAAGAVTGTVGVAIAFARAQLGKPYVWGGTGPNSYDCSGLVQAAYRAAGVSLPRTTQQMIFSGQNVAKSDLRPGDLVFPDPGHVAIYTGGGTFIEAPHSGLMVREVPMWGFWRARRVVTLSTPATRDRNA
jgi:cell wall-associated NlpC family hydrolase